MKLRIVEWREITGEWARDHWKIQVSFDDGVTWSDIPVERLPDVVIAD